jgi:hypothetical protein
MNSILLLRVLYLFILSTAAANDLRAQSAKNLLRRKVHRDYMNNAKSTLRYSNRLKLDPTLADQELHVGCAT